MAMGMLLNCVILKRDKTRTIAMDFKVETETLGVYLKECFKNYLEAEDFGLALVSNRNLIYLDRFDCIIHSTKPRNNLGRYRVVIQSKTDDECVLDVGTMEEAKLIAELLRKTKKYIINVQ